MTKRFY